MISIVSWILICLKLWFEAAAPGLCGRPAGVLLSALARRKFECGGLAILPSLMKHDGTAEHGGNTSRSNYHKPHTEVFKPNLKVSHLPSLGFRSQIMARAWPTRSNSSVSSEVSGPTFPPEAMKVSETTKRAFLLLWRAMPSIVAPLCTWDS